MDMVLKIEVDAVDDDLYLNNFCLCILWTRWRQNLLLSSQSQHFVLYSCVVQSGEGAR